MPHCNFYYPVPGWPPTAEQLVHGIIEVQNKIDLLKTIALKSDRLPDSIQLGNQRAAIQAAFSLRA